MMWSKIILKLFLLEVLAVNWSLSNTVFEIDFSLTLGKVCFDIPPGVPFRSFLHFNLGEGSLSLNQFP